MANAFLRPRVKQIAPAGQLLAGAPATRAKVIVLAALAVLVPAVARVVPAAQVVRVVVLVAGQVRVVDHAANAGHLGVQSGVVAVSKTSCSHSISS